MTGWAATNTLRGCITRVVAAEDGHPAIVVGRTSEDEADAALALVEAALHAAQTAADVIVGDPEFPGRAPMTITRGQKEYVGRLAAALRAVREGK